MVPLPFEISEEELIAMSVEDVALAVLNDAHANREWNSYNWMNMAQRGYGVHGTQKLSQAWQWLYAKGAVARDYGQSATEAMFITDLGLTLLEDGPGALVAEQRLSMELHPLVDGAARRQFLLGEYEFAVLAAFRQIEIRVRELIEADDSAIGVRLMRQAFGNGGKLRPQHGDEGEFDARRELFAGAIGVFKNPASHREVGWEDPTEAAEAILFADLLMRMIERVAEETSVAP